VLSPIYFFAILLLSEITILSLLLNNSISAAPLSKIAFSNTPTLSQDQPDLRCLSISFSSSALFSIVILTVSNSAESNWSVVFLRSSQSQLDR
jgi:hypothetical protein